MGTENSRGWGRRTQDNKKRKNKLLTFDIFLFKHWHAGNLPSEINSFYNPKHSLFHRNESLLLKDVAGEFVLSVSFFESEEEFQLEDVFGAAKCIRQFRRLVNA